MLNFTCTVLVGLAVILPPQLNAWHVYNTMNEPIGVRWHGTKDEHADIAEVRNACWFDDGCPHFTCNWNDPGCVGPTAGKQQGDEWCVTIYCSASQPDRGTVICFPRDGELWAVYAEDDGDNAVYVYGHKGDEMAATRCGLGNKDAFRPPGFPG